MGLHALVNYTASLVIVTQNDTQYCKRGVRFGSDFSFSYPYSIADL